MFKNFTERARKVMALANQEAKEYDRESVSSMDVLLGIIKVEDSVACLILKNLKIGLGDIYHECEKGLNRIKVIRKNDLAKNLVGSALGEAQNLKHNYVGPEHLLLGILREEKSNAAQILGKRGLKYEKARTELLNILGVSEQETVAEPSLASLETEKERPVKCKIFQIGEKAAVYGEAKPVFRFEPIEEKLSSEKVETAITNFLSEGKELVRVVQSSVSFGVASAVVLTQITIFYKDKE